MVVETRGHPDRREDQERRDVPTPSCGATVSVTAIQSRRVAEHSVIEREWGGKKEAMAALQGVMP